MRRRTEGTIVFTLQNVEIMRLSMAPDQYDNDQLRSHFCRITPFQSSIGNRASLKDTTYATSPFED
jgi:hypothetical protein